MAQITKITCTCCGKEKSATRDFYTSFSPFHKATGRLHVCKMCMQNSVIENDAKSFMNMLRSFDLPFISHLYESAIQSNAYVGEYFKLINAKDFRYLTWNDSDFEGHKKPKNNTNKELFEQIDPNDDIQELTEDELKYLKSFWGKAYELDDLIWLQTEYEDWTNRYECDSKGMETLIQEICKQQLDINTRRAKNEKVDQQLKTFQDLLGSSNLKPVQETGANAAEQETFGTLIKKYENEKPIPEPEQRWKDVDGISKYVKVFFLGHLSRMLGIKNDYADEYWDEINQYTVEEPVDDEDGEDKDVIIQ